MAACDKEPEDLVFFKFGPPPTLCVWHSGEERCRAVSWSPPGCEGERLEPHLRVFLIPNRNVGLKWARFKMVSDVAFRSWGLKVIVACDCNNQRTCWWRPSSWRGMPSGLGCPRGLLKQPTGTGPRRTAGSVLWGGDIGTFSWPWGSSSNSSSFLMQARFHKGLCLSWTLFVVFIEDLKAIRWPGSA